MDWSLESHLNYFQKYKYEGWTDTIASGWGATSFGGAISNTLQYIKIQTVSDEVCNEPGSYGGAIDSDTMICAGDRSSETTQFLSVLLLGFPDGSKDTCLYDTGGPLVTKATGVDDGYSLIGVVSFGDGCGAPNKYGVSTEFSNYLDWVTEVGLAQARTTSIQRKRKTSKSDDVRNRQNRRKKIRKNHSRSK